MPVWRVSINEVNAERSEKSVQGITVEVKPYLGKASIEKAGNTELVKVEYQLTAKYQPDVGSIEVGGDMFFMGLDTDEDLKKGRIVNTEVIRQGYSRIFVEPMVVAIDLAKELKLPLPVRMPEVNVRKPDVSGKEKKNKKKGKKKGKKKKK